MLVFVDKRLSLAIEGATLRPGVARNTVPVVHIAACQGRLCMYEEVSCSDDVVLGAEIVTWYATCFYCELHQRYWIGAVGRLRDRSASGSGSFRARREGWGDVSCNARTIVDPTISLSCSTARIILHQAHQFRQTRHSFREHTLRCIGCDKHSTRDKMVFHRRYQHMYG
jgi:hypothetical protein